MKKKIYKKNNHQKRKIIFYNTSTKHSNDENSFSTIDTKISDSTNETKRKKYSKKTKKYYSKTFLTNCDCYKGLSMNEKIYEMNNLHNSSEKRFKKYYGIFEQIKSEINDIQKNLNFSKTNYKKKKFKCLTNVNSNNKYKKHLNDIEEKDEEYFISPEKKNNDSKSNFDNFDDDEKNNQIINLINKFDQDDFNDMLNNDNNNNNNLIEENILKSQIKQIKETKEILIDKLKSIDQQVQNLLINENKIALKKTNNIKQFIENFEKDKIENEKKIRMLKEEKKIREKKFHEDNKKSIMNKEKTLDNIEKESIIKKKELLEKNRLKELELIQKRNKENLEKINFIKNYMNEKPANENEYLFKVLEKNFKLREEKEIKKEISKKKRKNESKFLYKNSIRRI